MGLLYGEYIKNYNDDISNIKNMVDPGLFYIIQQSKKMSMKDLVIAQQIKDKVIEIMVEFHKKYDLLITPTTATLPLNGLSYKDDLFMIDPEVKTFRQE